MSCGCAGPAIMSALIAYSKMSVLRTVSSLISGICSKTGPICAYYGRAEGLLRSMRNHAVDVVIRGVTTTVTSPW